MTLIRILMTIIYLWIIPLLIGGGLLLLIEKQMTCSKAWFWGCMLHTALFAVVIRFAIARGWENRKITMIWIGISIVFALIGLEICIHRRLFIKSVPGWKHVIAVACIFALVCFVCLLSHVTMTETSGTVIADATVIYRFGTPAAIDCNVYTGSYTGAFTNGTYDAANVYLASYYACVSTIAGCAPTTVVRFIISPLILMEALLVVYLISSVIWPGNRKACRWMFAAFVIIELSIMFSSRGEMLQLLTTTWSSQVIACYILFPVLLYAFLDLQERGKWDLHEKLSAVMNVVMCVVCIFFYGSMCTSRILLVMGVWCVTFALAYILRRCLFHD